MNWTVVQQIGDKSKQVELGRIESVAVLYDVPPAAAAAAAATSTSCCCRRYRFIGYSSCCCRSLMCPRSIVTARIARSIHHLARLASVDEKLHPHVCSDTVRSHLTSVIITTRIIHHHIALLFQPQNCFFFLETYRPSTSGTSSDGVTVFTRDSCTGRYCWARISYGDSVCLPIRPSVRHDPVPIQAQVR